MDLLSVPPSKKYKIDNIDIPMIECKRKFNLPHKFPSMVKPATCNYVFKIHQMVSSNKEGVLGNIMDPKNRKTLAINNIKKLRLKAKDGKDLGEVKVQFLAPNDSLNGQKITSNKQTINHKIDSHMKLSIVEPNELLNSLGSKNDVTGQLVLKSVSSTDLSAVIKNKPTEMQDKRKKLFQKHYFLAKVDKAIQEKKVLMVGKNENKELHNTETLPKNVTLKKANLSLANDKSKNLMIKKKHLSNSEKKIQTETKLSNVKISNTNKHWQLAKSKFPVVKCEKLTVPKSTVNINEINISCVKVNNKNQSFNSNVKTTVTKENIKSSTNLCCTKPSDNKKTNLNTSTKEVNTVQKKPYNIIDNEDDDSVTFICDQNVNTRKDFSSEQGKTCNSLLSSIGAADNKNESVSNDVGNKLILCQNKMVHNNKDIQNKESNLENSSDINETQKTANNILREDKLLEHWNVIKEALTSVTDEELRAKALQALTECGIGIAKKVPIIPPKQLKTVHDSQIQTDVFGLLDTKSFVLVNKDTPTLERIQQTERSTITSPVTLIETEIQTEPQIDIQMKQNVQSISRLSNPIDNIDVFPMWTTHTLGDILDIDNFFNEQYINNTTVDKVKKVLSTPPCSLYKKVAMQLEKDYQGMQQFDENGMLNIHRAVANNQLQEVQRLLLVLQASKTDIDVLTANGVTSLELAIQLDAPESILKVLLEAGAKPLFPELLRESAVILASKMSSPFLPTLLNYVKNSKLLDQVDSYGFAPLHYCTLKGNIDGVKALIKAGADVNLRDNRSGRTSLFHAIENNYIEIVHILVQNNAIVDLLNYSGQSALNLVHMTKNLPLKTLKQLIP
ncbi:B-cell lymphoma 3 protein homolog [Anthophora quadrimaculata]